MDNNTNQINEEIKRLSKMVSENNKMLRKDRNAKRIRIVIVLLVLLSGSGYSYYFYRTNIETIYHIIDKVEEFSMNLNHVFSTVNDFSDSITQLKDTFSQ